MIGMEVFTESLSFGNFVLRLGAALFCGVIIGLEREMKHKPAGVNAFMIVSMASAAYTMATMEFAAAYADSDVSADPTRLVQGLVGGMGFLGAGAIIGSRSGDYLQGIATGALIWLAGSIGIACGLGLYVYALIVSVMAAAALIISEFLQLKFGRRKQLVEPDPDDEDNDRPM